MRRGIVPAFHKRCTYLILTKRISELGPEILTEAGKINIKNKNKKHKVHHFSAG